MLIRILPTLVAFVFLAHVGVPAQRYSIEQYLNIKSAASPVFSPNGKEIAYLSNQTGTTQIWKINSGGGSPSRVTDLEDNVSFVKWLPSGRLLFGKAKGGDENTQFYTIEPNGTGMKAILEEPGVRHNFGLLSADGDVAVYSSNKRNRNYFDIYALDLGSGKETLLFQSDADNSALALGPEGSKLIISRSGGELSLDNNLYLYDLKAKRETLLTPHEGPAEFGSVGFLPDGKSLLLAQNDKREFVSLTNMRLRNAANSSDWSDANREMRVLDETAWDVSSIELPPNAGMFAYAINREGYSELFLRGIETDGKPLVTFFKPTATKIELPARGIVGGLEFNADQTKLAFSFSSPRQNSDVWIYDVVTRKLTQLTRSDRAGIDPGTFVTPELVKYKTFDGLEIPAWYYRTPSRSKTAKLPVIVNIHGGPEGQSRPGFSPLFQYFLSRGYAILDPNVRGSTGYGKTYTHLDDVEKREDSVKDIAAGHSWLVTRGNADRQRIAVMGGSYGGYMTMAAITLYPDLWAAAVNTVGIVNWETFLKNTSGYRRRQREVEYGRLDRDIEFLRRISPLGRVDRIRTPLFVIHGKNDPRVPYTEAEQIVAALRKRGAPVEYKLYDDEGHGISKLKNRLDLYPLVADFLDRHMGRPKR